MPTHYSRSADGRVETHNVAGSVTGIQGGHVDGETVINGRRVTPTTPAPAPGPPPAPSGGLGDLRAQLAQIRDQVEQLAQAQAALVEHAEQVEAQLKPVAMESSRDEPVDAWLAVQQVRQTAEQQQAQLNATLTALNTYRTSL